jgi:hypothetical protein
MAVRAGTQPRLSYLPVLPAVREVAAWSADFGVVVESGFVVDAGEGDWWCESGRDYRCPGFADVIAVAGPSSWAVVDEPPPARVMEFLVRRLAAGIPFRSLRGHGQGQLVAAYLTCGISPLSNERSRGDVPRTSCLALEAHSTALKASA